MQADNTRRGVKYYLTYFFWYSFLFAVVTAGVFFVFLIEKRSLVWNSDAIAQYVPKAAYFGSRTREMLASFLHGDFTIPMYDFALGMGNAIPIHLEPLYWLYLLFDAWDVEKAFDILMLVRYYLAGVSISVFLFYFKNSRTATLLGTFAYVYCDYAMWACMRHTLFEIALILLPLSLLCIEEIYRKKRWYLMTVLMVVQMWCGFYFAYMNTIAMGVYFLIRFFGNREGRTFKEFWLRMRTIVCSYTLGVAMGCLSLAESLGSYLSSTRTEAMEYSSGARYLTYGITWPIKIFRYFLTAGRGPGNWLRLGFIPLIYVALVVLFLRKGRKNLKAAVITGFVFIMLPVVAFVFSGFGNINNRWCYILAFVFAVTFAFTAEDLVSLTPRERWIVTAACVPFLALFVLEALFAPEENRSIVLLALAVLLLTLAVLWMINSRKKMTKQAALFSLVALAVISHWCYGFMEYAPGMGNVASEYVKSGKVVDLITKMPLAAMDEVEDDTFYRAATKLTSRPIQGASQFYRYNGTVYYTSTLNKNMLDFYRKLGLTSWSTVRLKGFDGRSFLDALASVKYYALTRNMEKNLPYGYTLYKDVDVGEKEYSVFENGLALPIGYTYDKVIDRQQFEAYDTAARQEVLMQAAVLEDVSENPLAADADEINLSGTEVPIRKIKCKNLQYEDHQIVTDEDEKKKPVMTIKFEGLPNSEVYLYISGLTLNDMNSTMLTYRCGDYLNEYDVHGVNNIYWTRQDVYIMNLGYHSEAVKKCKLIFENNTVLDVGDIKIFCQPMDHAAEYVDNLRENVLENVQVQTNGVSGTIALEKEKLLVLSIPYQSGWTALVDGKETELFRANLMYMALPLTAGTHTIELRYELPGFYLCLTVSAVATAVFILALVIRRKRRYAAQHHHPVL